MQRVRKVSRGSDRIDINQSLQLYRTLRVQYPRFNCEAYLTVFISSKLDDCSWSTVLVLRQRGIPEIMEHFNVNTPTMSILTDQRITFLIAVLRSAGHSQL